MNIRKLLITGAAAAMVFGVAAGAFAGGGDNNCSKRNCPTPTPVPVSTVTVQNMGNVDNTSVSVANTGANFVSAPQPAKTGGDNGKHGKDNKVTPITVTTGEATANQTTTNGIGTTSAGCGCTTTGVSTTSVYNSGLVSNLSVNVANSGLNMVSGGSLITGNASASQVVSNTINTSVGAM